MREFKLVKLGWENQPADFPKNNRYIPLLIRTRSLTLSNAQNRASHLTLFQRRRKEEKKKASKQANRDFTVLID